MARTRKESQSIKLGRKARTGKASDVRITVRFDADEARRLLRDAGRKGTTVSALIRQRAV